MSKFITSGFIAGQKDGFALWFEMDRDRVEMMKTFHRSRQSCHGFALGRYQPINTLGTTRGFFPHFLRSSRSNGINCSFFYD